MTRPFFQVHGANTVARAKWRRTDPETRGALLTVWMIASVQSPEGEWPDRQAVVDDLEADGFRDAGAVVDKLIGLRWLDEGETVTVHDWPDWQPPLPMTEAERKRLSRARQAVTNGPDMSGQSQSVDNRPDSRASLLSSSLRTNEVEERSSSSDYAREPEGDEDQYDPALGTYYELTLSRPWGKPASRWIMQLVDAHGPVLVEAAIRVEWRQKPDTPTLLGRVAKRLDAQADRAKRASDRERPKPPPEPVEAPPSPEMVEAGKEAWKALSTALGPSRAPTEHRSVARRNGLAATVGEVLGSGPEAVAPATARLSLTGLEGSDSGTGNGTHEGPAVDNRNAEPASAALPRSAGARLPSEGSATEPGETDPATLKAPDGPGRKVRGAS